MNTDVPGGSRGDARGKQDRHKVAVSGRKGMRMDGHMQLG
jgi:hypothetical protein